MNCDKQLFKILIIGDAGVGKSCLLERFSDDTYTDENRTSIGVDFKIRSIQIAKQSIRLQIWDTAGQERFKTITTAYFRGAHGIMIVYDTTDLHSYHNTQFWLQEILAHANKNVNKILIGSKCDKIDERAVDIKKGEELANILKIPFYEVSSKSSINVDEAFFTLARQIKNRNDQEGVQELANAFVNVNSKESQIGCC